MRYTKGKWVASRKDTYSVETTLNKIVLAHLIKLYECLKKNECHGIPMSYVEKQALIDGTDPYSDNVDLDKADELRFNDLEELIWVFGDNEPKMEDYDFTYNWDFEPLENGASKCNIECTNEAERNRYHEDIKDYVERRDKAYKLFGEVYDNLSW